jgi:multiple antibiotic resistance protein
MCFVPLFVAVDAIGILPMFMNLTEGLEQARIRRVIIQSVITATVVALVFLAIGKFILMFLGITVADFMIAGGVLLFIISLSDMLTVEKRQRSVEVESLGAVPLGVPLIVGPAVLTTTILLINQYGFAPTISATIVNIGVAGVVFWFSSWINRLLGKSGAKIISKLASLLLAAIAVMMVRKGIMTFL